MRMLRLLAACAVMALAASPAAGQVYTRIPTKQVSVGTGATLIAAAQPARYRIIFAVGAANACAFGGAGVTLTTGFALQPTAGATLTLQTNADVYAVCSAATTISVLEETR